MGPFCYGKRASVPPQAAVISSALEAPPPLARQLPALAKGDLQNTSTIDALRLALKSLELEAIAVQQAVSKSGLASKCEPGCSQSKGFEKAVNNFICQ
eukprot:5158345-Amphidinium_carterae.2